MTAVVLRGDARSLPLPDDSVDLVVTSPPYFGLRSYTDGGEHYEGQIGSEETPREYIDALLSCTREWMRVLKPEGSIFVNLGDSYYSGKGAPGCTTTDPKNAGRNARRTILSPLDHGLGLPRKSLVGTPWRYAIGCIDELGLTLRAEIVWDKPNGLPESVTDRVRRSHEQIFHFTKQPRYYSAVDEIREAGTGRGATTWEQRKAAGEPMRQGEQRRTFSDGLAPNPLGKLPGSVWEIPSQPLIVPDHLGIDHFAAFPTELPSRIIQGWSPPGICTACCEGRHPVTDVERTPRPTSGPLRGGRNQTPRDGHPGVDQNFMRLTTISGYACACLDASAPTRPAVVLDPFGGTGTTSLVADMLGRTGVSLDRSMDYARLARWRTQDPAERARALGVPKPPPVIPGQLDLLTGEAS